MKKFFNKTIKVLGILMLILLIALIVGSIIGYRYYKNQHILKSNTVLSIKFSEDIPERSKKVSFAETMALGDDSPVSMREILELIEFSAEDPKIKAISISGKSFIRHSKTFELFEAIMNFKKSGKPVYAYGDFYTQGGYTLAQAADSIFINPSGNVDLAGFSAVLTYFKDFFEKYHVDMEVYVAGKYKSFVEAYTRNSSSKLNRDQYMEFLNEILDEMTNHIAKNRDISTETVRNIIQNSLSYNSDQCLDLHLVDEKKYMSEYLDLLQRITDNDEDYVISLSRYKKHYQLVRKKQSKANVAYVVLDGNIVQNGDGASAEELRSSFRQIRKNDDIKTIILRINSPGGSAFASEDIYHEIELCKKAGKEIISSVSSLAASGGYYAMANSDKIFALPSSLTGSIGVFIAFPVFKNSLEENFSIHIDEIKTGPFASRTTGLNELTSPQKKQYQLVTDELYAHFIDRVATGRNLTIDYVDTIAQGRVYSGVKAVELGLIDSLLSLQGVFDYVKNTNNLDELILDEFPKTKEKFLPKLDFAFFAKSEMGISKQKIVQDAYLEIEQILAKPTPQARLPISGGNW